MKCQMTEQSKLLPSIEEVCISVVGAAEHWSRTKKKSEDHIAGKDEGIQEEICAKKLSPRVLYAALRSEARKMNSR